MTAPVDVKDLLLVLNRAGPTPLYLQLAALLRGQIERGEWRPGQKIPSENELNRRYGISRMTIRQVLTLLVKDGLLFRVHGKGTFVAHHPNDTRPQLHKSIREQLQRLANATTDILLSADTIAADPQVAQNLQLPPEEPVHRIRRLRTNQQQPISLHTSYVPTRLAPDLPTTELMNHQLSTILEQRYGLSQSRVTQSLDSTLPTVEDAQTLQLDNSTPLLLLRQDIADATARRFAHSEIAFRSDKARLRFHYSR